MDSREIKESIKKKLIELNKYSDGLPDYIALMISNKKSLESITKDLELFLREHNQSFVKWINDYVINPGDVHAAATFSRNQREPILFQQSSSSMNRDNGESCNLSRSVPRRADNEDRFSENWARHFKKSVQEAATSASLPVVSSREVVFNNHNVPLTNNNEQMYVTGSLNMSSRLKPATNTNMESSFREAQFDESLQTNDLRFTLVKRKTERLEAQKMATDSVETMSACQFPATPTYTPMEVDEPAPFAQTETSGAGVSHVKCKFWPNCMNASCPFVHPSEPCKHFPKCFAGKNCLFIHPMCKFNQRCTNAKCIYMHGAKAEQPTRPRGLCHFGANCTNPSCKFVHPRTPNKGQMKYVAPHYQNNQFERSM